MPPIGRLLPCYPEVDLIDYDQRDDNGDTIPLVAPLPTLINPHFDDEFKVAAARYAEKMGENPLSLLNIGISAYDLRPRDLRGVDLRVGTDEIHPVPEILHPPSLKFYENLNPGGKTLLYKVSFIWEGMEIVHDAVLKVFPDDDPNPDLADDADVDGETTINFGLASHRYYCEAAAYSRLMYHGVSEMGHTPKCYGRFLIDMAASDGIPDAVRLAFAPFGRPPRCLLCKYIPDAQHVSISNANESVARNALIALQAVHKAFVQQNDISPRNILVTANDRVVLVDFDHAIVAYGAQSPNRSTMMHEFMIMWDVFYHHLIPNSFIGWDCEPPQYPRYY